MNINIIRKGSDDVKGLSTAACCRPAASPSRIYTVEK